MTGVSSAPVAGGGSVVGVTGHRDTGLAAADLNVLTRRVDDVLRLLAGRGYGRVVTGLAEGADRLLAARSLDMEWQLVSILPFEPERYERDFRDAVSRAEFRHLMASSATVEIAAAGGDFDGGTPVDAGPDEAYAALGRLLVERSDLVLAVWDGEAARGPGGTGDVVVAALETGLPVVWIHARPPHEIRFADMREVAGPLSPPLAESLGPLLDRLGRRAEAPPP